MTGAAQDPSTAETDSPRGGARPIVTIFDLLEWHEGPRPQMDDWTVATRYLAYLGLEAAGRRVTFLEDLVEAEVCREIDDEAYTFSYAYCRALHLTYGGVDLGTLLRDVLARHVAQRLKMRRALGRVVPPNSRTSFRVICTRRRREEWEKHLGRVLPTPILVDVREGEGGSEVFPTPMIWSRRVGSPLFAAATRLVSVLRHSNDGGSRSRREIWVRHIPVLRYLIDSLERDGRFRVIRLEELGSPRSLARARQEGASGCAFIDSALTGGMARRRVVGLARARVRELESEWRQDLGYQVAREEIHRLVSDVVPDYLRWIDTLRRQMLRHAPAAIVLHEDCSPKERTVALTARVLGVKTLVVQHGVVSEPRGHSELFADVHAVWGDFHRRRYIAMGNAPGRLRVTGHPFRDRLREPRRRATAAERAAIGVPADARVVTVAARNAERTASAFRYEDSELKYFHVVHDALRDMPGIVLVLKLHPRDGQTSSYRRLIELMSNSIPTVLLQDVPLDRVLPASDVIICPGSTAVVEAVDAGVPAVFFDISGRQDIIRYEEYDAVSKATDAIGLRELVDAILTQRVTMSDDERVRFLEDFLFVADSQAQRRIADLTIEVAG